MFLGNLGDRLVLRKFGGPTRECRAEREERHERDASLSGQLHDRVILAVDDAVRVLDLADLHQL
jgi:hypothetical protein